MQDKFYGSHDLSICYVEVEVINDRSKARINQKEIDDLRPRTSNN